MSQQNLKLVDGSIFSGTLDRWFEVNKVPVGQGTLTFANGYKFEGRCGPEIADPWSPSVGVVRDPQNQLLSGLHADIQYLNWHYSGDYVAGRREGFGVMTRYDRATCEGPYTIDRPNGLFIYTNAEGKQFQEQYEAGKYVDNSQIPAREAEMAAATMRRTEALSRRSVSQVVIYPVTKQEGQSELIKKLYEEIASKTAEIVIFKDQLTSTTEQMTTEANEHKQIIAEMELANAEKVQQIKNTAEQYVKAQLQNMAVGQGDGILQQQVQNLSQQLQSTVQSYQLKERNMEVEMLRGYAQLNNEIVKQKDEVAKQKDLVHQLEKDLLKNQAELAKAKNNFRQDFSCRRCGAQFLDMDDLSDHQKGCSRIMCPLCEMKFRQIDQFYEHVGSHMKRDDVVAE